MYMLGNVAAHVRITTHFYMAFEVHYSDWSIATLCGHNYFDQEM